MSLILYINGQQADLAPGTTIAQTRQVNDLNSLENRQASYTNKFNLPKTAHNLRLMNFLTLTGNSSTIPYQKNTCSLYSSSGECFVYNGWGVVTDGGDTFEVVVYDGIVDLYKAIENKTLADLDLQELQHTKNPDTVLANWQDDEAVYRYILADYNGNNFNYNHQGKWRVNVEYLVPSVKVAWLWKRIFQKFNRYTLPTGTVFTTEEFTNLWLTFPKGASHTGESENTVFSCEVTNYIKGTDGRDWLSLYIPYTTPDVPEINGAQLLNNRHIKVSQGGIYRLQLEGNVKINQDATLNAGINAQNIANPHTITNRMLIADFEKNVSLSLNEKWMLNLSAGDTVCVFFDNKGPYFDFYNDSTLTVSLIHIQDTVIDFAEAFSDFSIRDFVNEIVYRFGLTLFKDKYENQYEFLTLEELLFNSPREDWSKKFVSKKSENYITGSYAQRNWFTYTYNDKAANHHDWYIDIANENLAETKTLIKSRIYSPEQQTAKCVGKASNVYKMWDKEIGQQEMQQEDGTTQTVAVTSYKPLDKRYYLMRCYRDYEREYYPWSLATLQTADDSSHPYRESFSGLGFRDTVQAYYSALSRVTDKSRVVTAELWLTEADIANFSFKKLYYIEQLSGNFLVNKINNYIPGKPTSCELLRVLPNAYGQLPFYITSVEGIYNDTTHAQQLIINFITNLPYGPQYMLQYEYGDTWVNPTGSYESPITFTVPPPLMGNRYKLRLWCEDGTLSNALYITFQGNFTVYPQ